MLGFTKSLKGRFAAYFALSIIISLLISGFLAGGLLQRYLKQKTITDLQSQVEAFAKQVETEGLPNRRYITDMEKMYQTRILIIPYGDQTLGRLPQPGPKGDQADPNSRLIPIVDWDQLRDGGTQVKQTDIPDVERDVIVVAHGVNAGGDLAGAVVLAKPIRLFQSWRPVAVEILLAGAASLAVSLLLAFLLARRLSRPLHQITQAATAVAEGDYSSELSVQSNDEIGRLADAFRYMTSEVRLAQEQQRQFVINVSHELKTPLTAIAGHAQALHDGIAADPQAVTKSVGVIVSETKRLSRLIEDLLSLAKFDARQFELKRATVEAASVVEAVVDSLARDAGDRGIQLAAASPATATQAAAPPAAKAATATQAAAPPAAKAATAAQAAAPTTAPAGLTLTTDPDRLRQVLSNLVQNALSHTPAGGSVTISTQVEAPSAGINESASETTSTRIAFEVADTGEGISPEDLPHVFDRFYRAENGTKSAGLGLGLAISRELTRALGGDITVTSTPGKGSRFTVILPS